MNTFLTLARQEFEQANLQTFKCLEVCLGGRGGGMLKFFELIGV